MMSDMAARPRRLARPPRRGCERRRARRSRGSACPSSIPTRRSRRLSIAEMQLVEIAARGPPARPGARARRAELRHFQARKRAAVRRRPAAAKRGRRPSSTCRTACAEVLDLADRITVMRDGRMVETLDNRNCHGRSSDPCDGRPRRGQRAAVARRRRSTFGSARSCLSVEDLTAPGLDGVSFEVRAGEILGVGGLAGFRQGWSRRGACSAFATARGPRRD